jgi:PRTRC genetic system protein E
MFTELLPMVRNRKVTFIVIHNPDDTLTVNVVPTQIRDSDNPALSTALSPTGVTGTAEELDRELPQALVSFDAQHLSLAAALAQSAAEMETAKKSAAEAAKQSSKEASEKWKKTKTGAPPASTPAPAPAPPTPPSLFDAAPAAEPAAQTTAPAHAGLFDAAPAGTPAPAPTDECFDDEDPDPENGEYADEHEEEQTACVA